MPSTDCWNRPFNAGNGHRGWKKEEKFTAPVVSDTQGTAPLCFHGSLCARTVMWDPMWKSFGALSTVNELSPTTQTAQLVENTCLCNNAPHDLPKLFSCWIPSPFLSFHCFGTPCLESYKHCQNTPMCNSSDFYPPHCIISISACWFRQTWHLNIRMPLGCLF